MKNMKNTISKIHQKSFSKKDQFIKKANKIHNNKYNYQKVNYINNKNKVIIVCSKHGEFNQRPNDHLSGYGCKKCQYDNFRYTENQFINICNKVHNNKYDYSKVKYKNNKTKVVIICPKHGEFKQFAKSHIKGIGCQKCYFDKKKLTKDQFIKKSNKIHNNKYDYSKVKYKNNRSKIVIICPQHGEFTQKPSHHMQGRGCLICNESKGEKEISKILNQLKIRYKREYKFKELGQKRFDFALFEKYKRKPFAVIEYQGEQHYKPIRFNGISIEKSKKQFKIIKNNDKIKKQFCCKNKINYISIPYIKYKELEMYLKIRLRSI